MPATNVRLGPPLVRDNPHYPGQFGVAGSDVPLGERLNTTGKILYVDPNYIGATTDPDGTNPMCPLSTIQSAVGKCTDFAGDVILVMHNDSWQYGPRSTARNTAITEDVVVNKHGISIIGVAQSSSVGVPWYPATATCCTVNALDVLIEGFAFQGLPAGGGTGILGVWDGTTALGDNLSVRNCWFGNGLHEGIILDYVWNGVIEDCEFQGPSLYGIYSDPAGSACSNLIVRRNWFFDCGTGFGGAIIMEELSDSLISDNWIFNSVAQSGVGVALEGIDTHSGGDNIVSGNFESCLLADWANFNDSAATDAWINNHLMDGPSVTNP